MQPVIDYLRHNKVFLTFLGALVVLLTYLFKDILRDDQRERIDAVENAQRVSLVSREIDALRAIVGGFSAGMPSPAEQSQTPVDAWKFRAPRDSEADDLIRKVNSASTYLEQGLFLCDVIPNSEKDRNKIEYGIQDLREAGQELDNLASQYVPADFSGRVTTSETAPCGGFD